MTTGFRFAPGGRQRLHLLDYVLDAIHGSPESVLGNQDDALDEAIYIILSFQTDLERLRVTWRRLRAGFPRWDDVDQALTEDVAEVLRVGGLHRQKAKRIKHLLRVVRREFGKLSLGALREMDDVAAEQALTRLPGLSWKGARCVLLYGLQRDTLPIDGNTFRIFARAGVIPKSSIYRRKALHDALQAAVQPGRRRRFHVNLVVHGQRVCVPGVPHCESCLALPLCARRGVARTEVGPGGGYLGPDQAADQLTNANARPSSRADTPPRLGSSSCPRKPASR